ncbi:hypothetical protein CBR_g45689 [Chara braunii]|uniref:Ribosomal protein S6 n=1 Tax=Chara braunii TaxID=69332 RepID=A0A388K3M1_CHABU|nr:hypothetical protein CBR_g45689 [Chara braunii]|eukprot:GBG64635.1 hypothetical protein CBR_g45689 [Chara braunii]
MGFTVAATGHAAAVCCTRSPGFTAARTGRSTSTVGGLPVVPVAEGCCSVVCRRSGADGQQQLDTCLHGMAFLGNAGGSGSRACRRVELPTTSGRRAGGRPGVVSPTGVAMQDSLAGMDEDPVEPRQYPPGLNRYETMVVIRPDMTEEERIALTERYEEAMITGGAMDVEMFNRGMQPLAYNIQTKNMGGASNRYLDGIYLLFTYVTKPESMIALQQKMKADDDVIRFTTFRLKI